MTRVWRGPAETRAFARHLRNQLTVTEELLWERLRNRGLGVRFRCQHPLAGYVADFYAPSINLDVEVDGDSHNERGEQDALRDLALKQRGILVVRISADDVEHRIDEVLAHLREVIEHRLPQ